MPNQPLSKLDAHYSGAAWCLVHGLQVYGQYIGIFGVIWRYLASSGGVSNNGSVSPLAFRWSSSNQAIDV